MGVTMAAAHRGDPHTGNDGVHAPVLALEVIELFRETLSSGAETWLVDGTVGAGGHARSLLETLVTTLRWVQLIDSRPRPYSLRNCAATSQTSPHPQ